MFWHNNTNSWLILKCFGFCKSIVCHEFALLCQNIWLGEIWVKMQIIDYQVITYYSAKHLFFDGFLCQNILGVND
jgi:hypothetical protein